MSAEGTECFGQVDDVVKEPDALGQHVVDIHLHVSTDLVLKDLIDEPLISRPYILQTERYYFIVVRPSVSDEGDLFFIFVDHLDLIIA